MTHTSPQFMHSRLLVTVPALALVLVIGMLD